MMADHDDEEDPDELFRERMSAPLELQSGLDPKRALQDIIARVRRREQSDN